MTWQVVVICLAPFLLVGNFLVMRLGFRGSTVLHAVARWAGVAGVAAFFVFVLALLDRVSQVWVIRSSDSAGVLYIASAIVFYATSTIALVAGIQLERIRGE